MFNSAQPIRSGESQMDGNHVTMLHNKHAQLDQKLREENLRPQPDQSRIMRLKKQKLHIKEELAHI
jgi:hypothetical protein